MKTKNKKSGIELIAAERDRQITVEGWTPEHDDEHEDGELRRAALCYLHCGRSPGHAALVLLGNEDWPWDWTWFKPFDNSHRGPFPKVDRLRCLVKAGALARAEEDRLERRYDRTHSTVDLGDQSDARNLALLIASEIDRLQRKADAQ